MSSRVRVALLVLWTVAFALSMLTRGIPFDRISQAFWILTAVVVISAGTGLGPLRVLRDWTPLLVFLLAYDLSRGVADTLGMPLHVTEMVEADEAMFGVVPTVWLQDRLYDPAVVHWWDVAIAFVYLSHFFAVYVVAVVLYLRRSPLWRDFSVRLVALSFAGLATFMLLPAAPPWYAAQAGAIAPVDRITARGWEALGLDLGARLLEVGQASVNPVAAVPSLHAAFSLLVVVFLWPLVRSPWWRALLAAYPLAMAVSLVYGGEHYVVDILLGWVYVVVVVLAVDRWSSRRRLEPADLAEEDVQAGRDADHERERERVADRP